MSLSAHVSEETIIRKLIADGDGTSEDRRICQLFQLIGLLEKSSDKGISNKIMNILDQIELSFGKQCLVSNVHEEENKNYEKLLLDIESQIEQSSEKMNTIKVELSQANIVRKNRQEYEVLAKMIKEKPSRVDSMKMLKQLQEQLDKDLDRQKQLEQQLIEHRRNMYSLAVLLNSLDETNFEEQILSDGEDETIITTKEIKDTDK